MNKKSEYSFLTLILSVVLVFQGEEVILSKFDLANVMAFLILLWLDIMCIKKYKFYKNGGDLTKVKNQKTELEDKISELELEINKLQKELYVNLNTLNITNEIINYKQLEEELYAFQVGMFDKKYDYQLSEEYNEQLKLNRSKQKDIVKSNQAINKGDTESIFDDNLKKSEKNKFIDSICKLIIKSFNNECDMIIAKLTVSNVLSSRNRLETAKEQINKLVEIYNISISMHYYKLKVEELQLQYEYLVKIQQERDEQREIKERMREEAKVLAEIEKLEKEAQREQKLYDNLLKKVRLELEKANKDEKMLLELRIEELENNLQEAYEKMQRAKSMAQKTKSGYVYVISNIGSFGEDVYKIGMTRRLEPMERINELSSASVPFAFDVHAMIYSEDAPALEKDLHNKFADKRVNKVNLRKEFFKISLSEIEKEVNERFDASIEFTKLAEAIEYRQSQMMQT